MQMDLKKIALRLDNNERLALKYRLTTTDGRTEEIRTDRLLDVAEDGGLLYVERNGVPVYVKIDEAIELIEG